MQITDFSQAPAKRLFIPSAILGIGVIALVAGLRTVTKTISNLSAFVALFVEFDWLPALLAAIVVAGAISRPAQRAGWSCGRLLAQHSRMLSPLVVTAVLAVLAHLVYRGHPLSMDEYIVVFQSRVFAAGQLAGVFPTEFIDALIPAEFQNSFLVVSKETGRIASVYLPGFSLLLAPFSALGVPWLLNPVVGGACIYVVDRLGVALRYSERQRAVALLLTVAGAAFVVNAISFYSMASHALFNAVYALLLINPTRKKCAIAGLVGSVALVLHNPVPHTLFAAPWLIWLTCRSDRWRTLPVLALAYLPIFILLGPGWNAFTASLRDVQTQPAMGDVVAKQWWLAFTTLLKWPTPELIMARVIALAKLWIWSVPMMLVAAWLGARTHWNNITIRLMSLSVLATFVGYLFVIYTQGHGWGFRYLHSAWLMLPLLAAAVVPPTADRFGLARRDFGDYLAGSASLTALVTLPVQLALVGSYIDNHLKQRPSFGRREILVVLEPNTGFYTMDLVQNDPYLRNRPVIAVRLSDDRSIHLAKLLHPQATLIGRDSRGEVWGLAESIK